MNIREIWNKIKPPWQVYGMIFIFGIGFILAKIQGEINLLYASMLPISWLALSVGFTKDKSGGGK